MKGNLLFFLTLGFGSLLAQEWQEFELPDSIFEVNYRRVWDFDIDSGENLWIATTNGFVKWKGCVLEHYDKKQYKYFR